jgi:ElaB/YqjD/DUF883 family membrane-anchored ribosome-binding protein
MANTKAQVQKLKRKTKKHLSDAKKNLIAAEKKVHAYMSKHPEKAVLIAAGVAAAVSAGVTAALTRKKRR